MSSAGADGPRRGPKPGHPGLRQWAPRFLFRIPSKTRFSTQIVLKLAVGLVLCGEHSAQAIAILYQVRGERANLALIEWGTSNTSSAPIRGSVRSQPSKG